MWQANITICLNPYYKILKKLLTIITVTYNCRDLIRPTAESILKDKDDRLEYIVVDGGSDDGTVEELRAFGDKIDRLISEPDNGIYEAMNKGLSFATGEYVLFINAGDTIYSNSVLTRLFDLILTNNADVYYGDAMLTDRNGREIGLRSTESSRPLPESLNWRSLERGMVVSHQSFIAKRELAPAFDLQYRSSADIDWVIRCLRESENIMNTRMVISGYLVGGYSKQTHPHSLRERFDILSKHYGLYKNTLNHLIILFRAIAFKIKGKNLN